MRSKKALCSAPKMNLGGKFFALDGGRSHTQNKENGQKTRIKYEEGQYVKHLWLPSKEGELQEETEKVWKVWKGNRFEILATESEQALSRRA